jgi:hypothetical protein
MGTAADPGDHHKSPNSRKRRTVAMSHDSQHHHDAPSGRPIDEGSPESARAANLVVGIAVALLLIALGVVVALA